MRQRQQNDENGAAALGLQLVEGSPVYDRDGKKIGVVDGYDAQANLLVVRKGLLFPHDVYAPLSAISGGDANGVYLNMTVEDLKGEGYAVAAQSQASELAPFTTSQTAVSQAGAPVTPTTPPATHDGPDTVDNPTGEITLPLAEEQLVPQVETAPLGDVRLHKGVRMVEREVTVPVGHDEVVVEHLAPDQFDASQPPISGEIIIPILEERVITQTVTVVKEYLRVRTKRVVEQQVVRAQTRQEYLDTGDDQRYVETRQ